MTEQELREKLAQEIEAEMRDGLEYDSWRISRNKGLKRAAYIVRGGKKVG